MNEEFRLPKKLLWLGVVGVLFFTGMLIASIVLTVEAKHGGELTVGIAGDVLWTVMALLSVLIIAGVRRERLQIRDNEIAFQGVWKTLSIRFDEVVEINWWSMGEVVLKTETEKLRLSLSTYGQEVRVRFAAELQRRCSRAVHKNWPTFCSMVAPGVSKLRDDAPLGPDEMRISRKRWTCFFIPGIVLAEVIGLIVCRDAPPTRPGFPLVVPIPFLLLWGVLVVSTPKTGLRTHRPTREESKNNWFLAFCYPVSMVFVSGFCWLSRNWSVREQLLYGLPTAIAIVGLFLWKFIPFARKNEAQLAERGARRIAEWQKFLERPEEPSQA